ncbi:MAG: Asp-tRNA(Asn)/Glu-tRNA(Gln) amidotransferase subunit GatA [Candidatus Berkelbacteria bacterium]
MELYKLTIEEASKKLKAGEITSSELLESVIDRIEQVEPEIKSYITKTFEIAREQARESDKRYAAGKSLSDLDGIPVALKDVFCTKGVKTTAASKILEDFIPAYNATVVEKLGSAGAIMLGKVNTDEFTMGSSTENSAFGPTHNPWDTSRVPGGSSGGSAAAVAADECLFALGTDTGGSIRQPASFCSATGLKVTYGLVSRNGVVSYASSFDTVGPIAKSAADVAIILNIIAGNDPMDSTSVTEKLPDYTTFLGKDIKGKKIGIPKEFYGAGLNAEVDKILKDAVGELRSLGAEVEEMSLPSTDFAIAMYYIIAKSEASSNLARYDGIRYGTSELKAKNEKRKIKDLIDLYFQNRTKNFGNEAKRSIMMGTYTLSSGYFDAYYKKASQVRSLIKKEYEDAFKKYDVLVTPVSPFPAFKIGEKLDDPLSMYLSDVNTVPINPAGVPAMSVPAGFTSAGLPVGMQIIGPHLGEGRIIEIADAFQRATEHHKKKPEISS